jgi:hypothetical protein
MIRGSRFDISRWGNEMEAEKEADAGKSTGVQEVISGLEAPLNISSLAEEERPFLWCTFFNSRKKKKRFWVEILEAAGCLRRLRTLKYSVNSTREAVCRRQ